MRDRLATRARLELHRRVLVGALTKNPGDATARRVLSWKLWLLGRKKEALAEVTRALELDPDHPSSLYVAAHLSQRACSFESLEGVRKANDARPLDAGFYGLLSFAYQRQRTVLKRQSRPANEIALRVAEDGLAIDPRDPTCLRARGFALFSLGRLAESVETFEAVAALPGSSAGDRCMLCWTYLLMLRPFRAFFSLRRTPRS
jgi:tetratricopeptide (TPR) repeat protein